MAIRLVCLLTVMTLTGCGLSQVQRDAIGQFSKTSAAFAENVSTQLTDARTSVIDVNTAVLSLTPKKVPNRDNIDGAFNPDRISTRIRAAQFLQTYGQVIQALVDDTQKEELRTAAESFKQSIRGLDSQTKKINDAQLGVIGDIIQSVGGLWIEHKKKSAIKHIVPQAGNQIDAIADLFVSEFSGEKGAEGSITKNVNAEGQRAVSAADSIFDDKDRDRSLQYPLAALAHRKGIETIRKTNTIYPLLATAANQLKSSHREITEALEKDQVTIEQLKQFTLTVKDLVAKTQLLLSHKE